MKEELVSKRLYALIDLFDMHTPFFDNVLEGISEEDSTNRLHTKANHIAWLAGSLVQERYELANLLGLDLKSTSNELFKEHKGIQENTTYPSLDSFKKDWKAISPILKAQLLRATDQELDKVLEFPGMSFPLYDMISFQMYREANCIGQIALWRRLLGYEAMKYM
ncbi:DinB family protein [Pedobacter sp. Du54]|uniref:DinB family protein n=1 Tax=Pedobacter anseongensis TaxID=3133439 RepID=UPI0030B0A267